MEWSRVTFDLSLSGQPLAARVERFVDDGWIEQPSFPQPLSQAQLVEYDVDALWLILKDMAMNGTEGWEIQPDWSPSFVSDWGPFDKDEF